MKGYILLIFLLPLFLTGCTKRVYVPVESTRITFDTDSINRIIEAMISQSRKERDKELVIIREQSTYVINEKGDTVSSVTERERDSSRETDIRESFYLSLIDSLTRASNRTDSIDRPVPYPVEVPVEVNRLYWWQKTLMWIGGIGLFVIGFLLLKK